VASTRAINAIDKAAAAFKKEERVREGQQAMAEYNAARAAEEKKIERLRALRLAREAADAAAPAPAPAARTSSAPKKRR
jgi:hypothetical protein